MSTEAIAQEITAGSRADSGGHATGDGPVRDGCHRGDRSRRRGPVGFACQSFASVSLEPRSSSSAPIIAAGPGPHPRDRRFCVNVLHEDQSTCAPVFGSSKGRKYEDSTGRSPVGAPRSLPDVLMRVHARCTRSTSPVTTTSSSAGCSSWTRCARNARWCSSAASSASELPNWSDGHRPLRSNGNWRHPSDVEVCRQFPLVRSGGTRQIHCPLWIDSSRSIASADQVLTGGSGARRARRGAPMSG